jgi:hypothetical protein
MCAGIPNPNVRTAIDGKQPTLTGSTILTGTITASNIASGTVIEWTGVCEQRIGYQGYPNVRTAIDGKQSTLTGSSNITTEQ